MSGKIVRRLLGLPFVLLGLVTVVFFLVRMIPGDPALLMAGVDATDEQVASLRAKYGTDQPLVVQYGRFLLNVVQGDMGESIRARRPALEWVFEALAFSAQLAVAGMAIALLLGMIAGVVAAVRRGTLMDTFVMMASLIGISVPVYMTAIVLILVFSVHWSLLPVAGAGGISHLILPTLSLGFIFAGELARVTRSAMLDVLSQDYMRTARAKGVSYWNAVIKHGLRNASIPILSVAGVQFGRLFGSAVITETIFAWPGLGRLLIDAIQWRDYPLIQACILVFGCVIVIVNMLTDIAYAALDPRIAD